MDFREDDESSLFCVKKREEFLGLFYLKVFINGRGSSCYSFGDRQKFPARPLGNNFLVAIRGVG